MKKRQSNQTFLSPAKLNLFLKVVSRRADGFHEIETLMQTISLFDTLSFSFASKDVLISSDPGIPTDRNNLIWKAVDRFREKTGCSQPLRVELTKRIPHSAGLGGGSSNAATTLFALNQLFQTELSIEGLASMGSSVGSDIPFFFSSGRAFCTGRGEVIQEIPVYKVDVFSVVKPGESLSTADVYRNFSLETDQSPFTSQRALADISRGWNAYFNELEAPAFRICPILQKMHFDLMLQGLPYVRMSGSGSALFTHGKHALITDSPTYTCHSIFRENPSWYQSL